MNFIPDFNFIFLFIFILYLRSPCLIFQHALCHCPTLRVGCGWAGAVHPLPPAAAPFPTSWVPGGSQPLAPAVQAGLVYRELQKPQTSPPASRTGSGSWRREPVDPWLGRPAGPCAATSGCPAASLLLGVALPGACHHQHCRHHHAEVSDQCLGVSELRSSIAAVISLILSLSSPRPLTRCICFISQGVRSAHGHHNEYRCHKGPKFF